MLRSSGRILFANDPRRLLLSGISGLCLTGLLTALPTAAHAQANFNRIIAFGDSLTDNGNLFAATGGTLPAAPYFQGRLSNSTVWVERVATTFGVPLTDFAVTGARTDTTNLSNSVSGVPPNTFPGIQTQVSNYLTSVSNVANPNALYVIWGGANDYLNGGQTNPAVPVTNILSQMTSLAAAGARQFLVPNLPDLGSLPGTSTGPFAGALNTLTAFHNGGLASGLSSFQAANPTLKVHALDVNTLFKNAIANPAQFGLTNVTQNFISSQGQIPGVAPLQIGTGDPNNYLFWDEVHPTSTGHQQVANLAIAAVNAPEPTTFALLGIGAAGMLLRRRRTTKNRTAG
jgi:phospholipase/lecithinase/hemolysin